MAYDEQIQSAVLQLQTLQSQFNLALTQYKQAYASYAQAIRNNGSKASAQVYLGQINTLNTRLSQLYSQIRVVLSQVNPAYQEITSENITEGKNLTSVYATLLEEKRKINELLADYQTLEEAQNYTSLKVGSNHGKYVIFSIIAVILIVLVFKQLVNFTSSSSEMRGGGNISTYNLIFNFILMILLLFLALVFKHSAGFILWGLIVLAYVLIKIKAFHKFK